MNLTVHQSIVIHTLKVDTVTNSSVLQIGTAGTVRALSNLYNTGGSRARLRCRASPQASAHRGPPSFSPQMVT
ncbi:spore germination protein GerPB [Paenibacillus sp. CC-CFT747]|nr:spore germination protein GerPB [Paenibacillus sp. CC-CFT747]